MTTEIKSPAPAVRSRPRARRRPDGSSVADAARPGFSWALPATVFFALFAIVPLIMVAVLSFMTWNGLGSPEFAGFDNWSRIVDDPVMIKDAKIGWPARLSLGPDGLGPAPEHIAHIMGQSMEGLIHHFKLITEGFRVPAGQAYVPIESARGELDAHVVSDGGTRPFRVHFRDPSFTNLQSIAALCEGGQVADVIPAIASIDPVMGGVDR